MAPASPTCEAAFADARRGPPARVVLLQQADMFDPTVTDPALRRLLGFQPLVQALIDESAAFHGPVYLFNGDSHRFHERPPAGGRLAVAHVLRGHRLGGQPAPDHRRRLGPGRGGLAQGDRAAGAAATCSPSSRCREPELGPGRRPGLRAAR